MSTIGLSHFRGVHENSFKAWWTNNVRDIAFGVLYAMVKENNFSRIFVIISIVIEFFQMIFFCFTSDFHWGGIYFDIKVDSIFVNYQGLSIVFWIVISLLILALANVVYIGYSFHQGEIKSINLLRTLRWICSLFVSVLFIPILYVLLGPLICDYSASPPILMGYQHVQCWGAKNTPLAIIAAVLVIIFSAFSLIVGLTYYEYDPGMIKTYSRLQNRFEFGSLLIKIVVVFVSLFLRQYPVVYALFSLVTSAMLVVGYLFMVPAYNRKINLVRTGSYAGIFWVNVCMVMALIINDRSNLTSTVAAGVGCPWLIALGAFLADKRIKYLCNVNLVDGFVSAETKPAQSPSRKPLKKGVKWDQQRSNGNLMKNSLYSRLRFPCDVEIAARFVLQDKPNAALIEKAKVVYHTGLCKFPNSPTVLMAYANFIFTTAGDWQLGYLTLEKLRKMNPFMDISFFIYRYDKDREQRIEGGSNNKIGDFVDFMEYKKLMRAAKQYHHMALLCIRKFWKHLLDSKIDVMQLSTLSSKIATEEKKASASYAKLIARYPKNIRVLRDYARFLDEVSSDERLAHEYWKKADRYEEKEMEKLTESHRSANNITEENDGDTGDEEKPYPEETPSLSDKSSHTSGDDNTSATSKTSGVKSGLEMAKNDKNKNLKKLGWIMFFTTLFAMVVMFSQLGVLNRQLGNFKNVINALDGAGGISHTGARAGSQAMDLYLTGLLSVEGNLSDTFQLPYLQPGWNYDEIARRIKMNSNLILNNVRSLYWGAFANTEAFTTNRRRNLKIQAGMHLIDPSLRPMTYEEFDHKSYHKKQVVAFFDKTVWNSTVISSNDDGIITRDTYITDLWSFSFLTGTYGSQISLFSKESIRELNEVETFALIFIVDNVAPYTLGVRALMDLYSRSVKEEVNVLRIICIAIFAAAVVLLFLACVVFFMPVVNSIFEYKLRTFHVFTLIPTSVVKHMAKRKISSLKTDASDGEDEEDNYNNTISISKNINNSKMTKVSSDTKFGVWKDGDKTEGESEEENTESKGMVEMDLIQHGSSSTALPNIPNPTSHTTMVHVRGSEGETPGGDAILPDSHLSIQVSSDEALNDNEESPDEELSVIQKIKNKIWLKMPANSFKKLKNEEEEEKTEKVTPEARKKSRMNTSSMHQVTRKLHLSYVFAILCFIIAMLVSFATLLTEFNNLTTLSMNLKNSDVRTLYAHLLLCDIQAITLYGYNDTIAQTAARNIPIHLKELYDTHQGIAPPADQMNWLYGTGCYRINQTACPSPPESYPYFSDVNSGIEFTLFQYLFIASDLATQYERDKILSYFDPQYIRFRTIAELDLLDGLERLTFLFQQNAEEQISGAKLRVGIITGIVCVAFVFIHVVLFKPFVNKLREESEHTFSIVRMIPRKMIGNIPEIQAFIQESTDGVNREDF